jgi:peptidoglycan/xylan/chitin deacetylase (PgdA/CDA1 family)
LRKIIEMGFAETASEAWATSGRYTVRSVLRSAVISTASVVRRPQGPFIRCLYGHAIFPEHASKFRAFLRRLKNSGDVVGSQTLAQLVTGTTAQSGRYFHLSFDDGLANVFEVGGDIMLSERVPATFFVATDLLGAGYEELLPYFAQLSAYARPVRTMTWEQVRTASRAGFEIGSHTQSHARLSDISSDPARLKRELAGARAIIEEQIGGPCRSFAWPYGTDRDIDDAGRAAIGDAAYAIAFSAVRGRVFPGKTKVLSVPRHQVEFHWPAAHLKAWSSGFLEKH